MPGSTANTVRQVVCLDRSSDSLLPLLPKKGGEGRGEEAVFRQFPLSPALFPLVPRGERGKNALNVFHAEHNWSQTRTPERASARRSSLAASTIPGICFGNYFNSHNGQA